MQTVSNENIESKLLRLGYTKSWLLFNVLTSEVLDKQLSELDSGEDTNEEHYRYKIFCAYLELKTSLNNETVDHLISLLMEDADKTMAASASIQLLKHQYLTDEQFDKVRLFVREFGEWTESQIIKTESKRLKK